MWRYVNNDEQRRSRKWKVFPGKATQIPGCPRRGSLLVGHRRNTQCCRSVGDGKCPAAWQEQSRASHNPRPWQVPPVEEICWSCVWASDEFQWTIRKQYSIQVSSVLRMMKVGQRKDIPRHWISHQCNLMTTENRKSIVINCQVSAAAWPVLRRPGSRAHGPPHNRLVPAAPPAGSPLVPAPV